MAVFPIDMALLPVFSPAFCFQNMQPHIQVGLCLIARSQNYTNLPDAWICGRFAGNFGRSYVHLNAVVLGIWKWPGMSLGRSQDGSHV